MPLELHQKMLDAQATDEVTVAKSLVAVRADNITSTVAFGDGTSAGVVKVEVASHEDGPWLSVKTFTWAAENTLQTDTDVGVHQHIRHRISTAIAGGTATSWMSA